VPEGRELPIEDCDHARLGWVKDQISESEIAMSDAGLVSNWDAFREPGDETLHCRIFAEIR
jgi:hypothetical protein